MHSIVTPMKIMEIGLINEPYTKQENYSDSN